MLATNSFIVYLSSFRKSFPVFISSFILILLCFVFSAKNLQAQNVKRDVADHFHAWVTHLGDHRVSDKLSLHTEFHIRRNDGFKNWQQLLIRPAINYHFNEDVIFTTGYSNYNTYAYGEQPLPSAKPEHHTFEQVQLKHTLGKNLVLFHRYRLEQRFQGRVDVDNHKILDDFLYMNRFRYRIFAQLPLKKWEGTNKQIFVNFYDEVFLNFGEDVAFNILDQNRISFNGGYQYNKSGNIQFGYLNQFLQKRNGIQFENNHTFVTTLVYNLDLRKKEEGS